MKETWKDRSSSVNPCLRELTDGASQYTFTCELQSGVFLFIIRVMEADNKKNGDKHR